MIYSNAAFVGHPETGMRYFNAQKDSGTGLRPLPKGAVEFVSTPASVAKLMQQIPGAGNQMKAFEALLHVKIAREVPVDMGAVAVRSR